MERVKLRSSSGIAKVAGVALCLAGVFTIALYTGPSVSPINHHRAFASQDLAPKPVVVPRGVWIKWTLLMVVANMCWSLWIICQVRVACILCCSRMLVCIHIHHTIMACSPCLLTVRVQAAVQKDYPDKMVVTVTQCLLSTAQSFVVAVVAERDFSKWKLRFDISLLAVLYSVISTISSIIW
jgi:hypothetical protein